MAEADIPQLSAEPASGLLDRIGSNVAKIAAIVGAVVAFNTALTTCSNDRVARYAAFHDAVRTEESFWKALYDDYLGTFDADLAKDEPRRAAKRFAIANLANHSVPEFEEFTVGDGLKSSAKFRLAAMRASLIDALQDKRASGNQVADAALTASFIADEAVKLRDRTAAAEPVEAAQAPPTGELPSADASLSYQTRVLATGSPAGWDIDLFWCHGADEGLYAAQAQSAGKALAQLSENQTPIAAGATLGRIRVRSLPVALQSHFPSGSAVVWDAGPGERLVADALLGLLQKQQKLGWRLVQSRGRTSWYVSVFLCPSQAQPAATAG